LPFSISRLLGAEFDSKTSSKLTVADVGCWDSYEAGIHLFGPRLPHGLLHPGMQYATAPGGAIIRVPAHRPSAPQPPSSPYPWLANMDPHLQRSAAFASHLVKERLTGQSHQT